MTGKETRQESREKQTSNNQVGRVRTSHSALHHRREMRLHFVVDEPFDEFDVFGTEPGEFHAHEELRELALVDEAAVANLRRGAEALLAEYELELTDRPPLDEEFRFLRRSQQAQAARADIRDFALDEMAPLF